MISFQKSYLYDTGKVWTTVHVRNVYFKNWTNYVLPQNRFKLNKTVIELSSPWKLTDKTLVLHILIFRSNRTSNTIDQLCLVIKWITSIVFDGANFFVDNWQCLFHTILKTLKIFLQNLKNVELGFFLVFFTVTFKIKSGCESNRLDSVSVKIDFMLMS